MAYKEIRRMLAEALNLDEASVTPDTPLWGDLDAVQLARLVIACERRFVITIDDECVSEFGCLRDLVRYVEERVRDGRNDYKTPSDAARESWYYQ